MNRRMGGLIPEGLLGIRGPWKGDGAKTALPIRPYVTNDLECMLSSCETSLDCLRIEHLILRSRCSQEIMPFLPKCVGNICCDGAPGGTIFIFGEYHKHDRLTRCPALVGSLGTVLSLALTLCWVVNYSDRLDPIDTSTAT